MATTIQISKELHDALKDTKISSSESYEDLLWDLLEDRMELSEETKKAIEKAKKEYAKGKRYSFEQVKKEAGLL